MDAIRIQNLRSLVDTGYVPIRPLTFLVGSNNSGKSSFLRALLLLRQSIESRTAGPLLWFGSYVDFGGHDEARTRFKTGDDITFSFKMRLSQSPARRLLRRRLRLPILEDLNAVISMCVGRGARTEASRRRLYEVQFADQHIAIHFDENENVSKLCANKLEISANQLSLATTRERGLFGGFYEMREQVLDASETSDRVAMPLSKESQTLLQILDHVLLPLHHHRTSEQKRAALLSELGVGSSDAMLSCIKSAKAGDAAWKRNVSEWTVGSRDFVRLRDTVLAYAAPGLIERLDSDLRDTLSKCGYIGPARAIVERYYREQSLSVAEVDFRGSNLPMVLRNLRWDETEQFEKWLMTNLGFSVSVAPTGSHLSIRMREKGGERQYNLADTGFGFSQILPVLTQVWLAGVAHAGNEDWIGETIFLAIEQPELHLHPRLQGVVAQVLAQTVAAARASGLDLRLVIETHSEAMLNALGHMIMEQRTSKDDVGVVYFERETPDNETRVRLAEFNAEGFLNDWPYGFFDPLLGRNS